MKKGLKDDEQKPRWDLLPLPLVEKIVDVYTFGAKKYKANSWQQVENGRERYYSALMRHLTKWRGGETIDPESGLFHLSHCGWNILALIFFEIKDGKK